MLYCCSPDDPMDCAERAACEEVGTSGHYSCGVCPAHRRPRHRCGCIVVPEIDFEAPSLTAEEIEAAWAELEANLGKG